VDFVNEYLEESIEKPGIRSISDLTISRVADAVDYEDHKGITKFPEILYFGFTRRGLARHRDRFNSQDIQVAELGIQRETTAAHVPETYIVWFSKPVIKNVWKDYFIALSLPYLWCSIDGAYLDLQQRLILLTLILEREFPDKMDLLSPLMMLELRVCSGRKNILLGNTELSVLASLYRSDLQMGHTRTLQPGRKTERQGGKMRSRRLEIES